LDDYQQEKHGHRTSKTKRFLSSLIYFSVVSFSPDASELSWTYPLHGTAFNWIHQRNEGENQLNVIECVHGKRIEHQLEFELSRQLFRFDNRHLNSKKSRLFKIQFFFSLNFSEKKSNSY
jgi:hypothetical protein